MPKETKTAPWFTEEEVAELLRKVNPPKKLEEEMKESNRTTILVTEEMREKLRVAAEGQNWYAFAKSVKDVSPHTVICLLKGQTKRIQRATYVSLRRFWDGD
jgi:hypothetical protein